MITSLLAKNLYFKVYKIFKIYFINSCGEINLQLKSVLAC